MAPTRKGSDGDEAALAAAETAQQEAQAALSQAQDAAAEAGQGLVAAKLRNVPDMIFEVGAGQTVSHGGKTYYGVGYTFGPDDQEENDTVVLPGPDAMALMSLGHGVVRGTA